MPGSPGQRTAIFWVISLFNQPLCLHVLQVQAFGLRAVTGYQRWDKSRCFDLQGSPLVLKRDFVQVDWSLQT